MNHRVSTKRFWLGALGLTLAMAISLAAVSVFAQRAHGESVVAVVSFAAISCWIGAILALLVTWVSTSMGSAVTGALGASACRFGIPLLTAVAGSQLNQDLASAGLFGFTVIFFLIALTLETPISLWVVHPLNSKARAVSQNV